MAKQPQDIIVADYQKGVADSAYVGIADMRNIDIYSEPGVAKINVALKEWTFHTSSNGINPTFTVVAATDILTTSAGDNFFSDSIGTATLQPVILTTTGVLPAGLSLNTVYYLIQLSQSTYKLAASISDAESNIAIDITGTGTGVHTMTAVIPGDVKHQRVDPATGYVYAQDSNGRIWVNRGSRWTVVSGNTLTAATGNGITIWKGYLIAARPTTFDALNLTTYVWTNGFGSPVTSTTLHKLISGQDDIVYFLDGQSIGTITAIGTFDPTSGATFTVSTGVLNLPQSWVTYDLIEYGDDLWVGGSLPNANISKLFPWNRDPNSSFELPLPIGEGPIKSMEIVGDLLYVTAGLQGNVWVTNSSSLDFAFRIPTVLFGPSASGGITSMCKHQNRLFMGVASIGASGVWSYNPKNGALVPEYEVSYGRYADLSGSNPLLLSSMISLGPNRLSASWYDSGAAVGAIDATQIAGQTTRYSSYSAYIISPLELVSNPIVPGALSQFEFQLAEPLTTSQGVKLYYRKDTSSSWVPVLDKNANALFDFITYGAITGLTLNFTVNNIQVVQIRTELTTTTSTVATTPKLLAVRAR